MLKILPLAALLTLAACATPSQRISSKLVELGVPPREASCVGDKLQNRLSFGQLRRIGEVARDPDGRPLRIADIAQRLTERGDPELVGEVIRAGVECAF